MAFTTKFNLMDNVTIYFNGDDEVRFRKGIWNYEEATLDITPVADTVKKPMLDVIDALIKTRTVDLKDTHLKYELVIDDYGFIRNIVESLTEQRYLEYADQDYHQKLVKEIIGGTISEYMATDHLMVGPILFITDNARLKDYAQMLAEDLEITLTFMNDADIDRIEKANILTKNEGLETETELTELERTIFPFSAVVVSLERPRLKFLRKLNRLLIKTDKPMVLSILDGPFLSITSVKGKETGCYECFEQRVIARNQSIEPYHRFYEQTDGISKLTKKTHMTPILQTFTSLAIFEGFLLATVNKTKLAGRVLNVYIPILEIQVEDLLRVSYCPACGQVAQAKYDEMYTNSQRVVRQLVDSVQLEKTSERQKRMEMQQA